MASYPHLQKHISHDIEGLDIKTKTEIEESEIWNKFRQGDEQAFIYIYKTYFKQLYNFAFQFTSDQDFIKDQIQDLFIYIRLKRENLKSVYSIKFYLFKILRRNIFKSKKRLTEIQERIAGNFSVEITGSHEQKIIESDINVQKSDLLMNSLKELSKRQREAIILFYYEGFTYAQIAVIMGYRNTKQVRKIIYRAIDKLKTNFVSGSKPYLPLFTF